uniref:MetA-pathway of phenol degradation n=1 Tax=Candidatus Kentrum sp. DK TaxID=2126562 RepID=A0A450RY42_9GAMM|nr:MAG: hypothetical protein BECKDK2373B_GA0170837_100721 [Candidatus Kentron sp. DK]
MKMDKKPSLARLSLLGILLSGTMVIHADDSPFRPDAPASRLPSSLPVWIPENLSAETSHAKEVSHRRPTGEGSISRMAGAYLDYTFLGDQTGRFPQNLQGTIGVTGGSAVFLSPLEQFHLGDIDSYHYGNGYSPAISGYGGHSDFMASLEWQWNAPGFADRHAFDNLTWGEVLRVSFFADYGKTISNGKEHGVTDALPARASKWGLSGIGIGTGLQFSLPGRLTANLKAAYPLRSWEADGTNRDEGPDTDGGQPRYWFDFSYNF